jgi:integrase
LLSDWGSSRAAIFWRRSTEEVATMPSAYITRTARGGTVRYRVRFRLGGAETSTRHGGSFETMREARLRRDWIAGELAAMRVPDLTLVAPIEVAPTTLREIAHAWRSSRIGVADGTLATYDVNLGRILPRLGEHGVDELSAADVAGFVAELHEAGLKRETIRKTLSTLAKVLDHAGRRGEANPARDRHTVELPYEEREEPKPPTAEHVAAVCRLLPTRYRLPLVVLDATGMRVGELEALTWGDVDEGRRRWRVTAKASKTNRARWVDVGEDVFDRVLALCPRDDRTGERRVFQGVTADRLRTALTRACTGAGVPAFSPHDLRHRRISLLHAQGVSWARVGELVGQRNLAVTANTYTHVLLDEAELDVEEALRCSDDETPVRHKRPKRAANPHHSVSV